MQTYVVPSKTDPNRSSALVQHRFPGEFTPPDRRDITLLTDHRRLVEQSAMNIDSPHIGTEESPRWTYTILQGSQVVWLFNFVN